MDKKKKDPLSGYGLKYDNNGRLVTTRKAKLTKGKKFAFQKARENKMKALNNKKARGIIFLELQKYKKAGGTIDFSGRDQEDILGHLIMVISETCEIDNPDEIEGLYLMVLDSLVLNGDLSLIEAEKVEAFQRHKQIANEAIECKDFSSARSANKDIMDYFGLVKKENQDPVSSYARYVDDAKEIEVFRGSPAELMNHVQKKRRSGIKNVTKVIDVEEKDA